MRVQCPSTRAGDFGQLPRYSHICAALASLIARNGRAHDTLMAIFWYSSPLHSTFGCTLLAHWLHDGFRPTAALVRRKFHGFLCPLRANVICSNSSGNCNVCDTLSYSFSVGYISSSYISDVRLWRCRRVSRRGELDREGCMAVSDLCCCYVLRLPSVEIFVYIDRTAFALKGTQAGTRKRLT